MTAVLGTFWPQQQSTTINYQHGPTGKSPPDHGLNGLNQHDRCFSHFLTPTTINSNQLSTWTSPKEFPTPWTKWAKSTWPL
eukprot:1104460-Amphidinium_carterae.1